MQRSLCYLVLAFVLVMPIAAQTQPTPLFLQATVDNTMPFVGQTVRYTLRIYTLEVFDDLEYMPPTFDDFTALAPTVEPPSIQIVDNAAYQVYTQITTLYPRRSGDVVISPATVKVPSTPFRETYLAQSPPISLSVKPLPFNAPVSFRQAVGDFTIDSQLDKNTVQLGDVLTLTLTVAGEGNFPLILAPEISLDPQTWRVVARPPSYSSERVLFAWSLIPLVEGNTEISSIAFSFFQPFQERFVTLKTQSWLVSVRNSKPSVSAKHANIAMRTEQTSLPPFPNMLWLVPLFMLVINISWGKIKQAILVAGRPSPSVWCVKLSQIQTLEQLERLLKDYLQNQAKTSGMSERTYIMSLKETERARVMMLRRAVEEAKYAPVFAKQDLQRLIMRFEQLLRVQEHERS